jgi:hypothetical protein
VPTHHCHHCNTELYAITFKEVTEEEKEVLILLMPWNRGLQAMAYRSNPACYPVFVSKVSLKHSSS